MQQPQCVTLWSSETWDRRTLPGTDVHCALKAQLQEQSASHVTSPLSHLVMLSDMSEMESKVPGFARKSVSVH